MLCGIPDVLVFQKASDLGNEKSKIIVDCLGLARGVIL